MMAKSSKKKQPRGDKYAHLRTNRLDSAQRSVTSSRESQLESTLEAVRSVARPRRSRKRVVASGATVAATPTSPPFKQLSSPIQEVPTLPVGIAPNPRDLVKQAPKAACETCAFCPKRDNICSPNAAISCLDEQEQLAYTEAFMAFINS